MPNESDKTNNRAVALGWVMLSAIIIFRDFQIYICWCVLLLPFQHPPGVTKNQAINLTVEGTSQTAHLPPMKPTNKDTKGAPKDNNYQ